MLNLLRSWLRRRKQPSLNLLYERLQELRVPPGEPDRSVYQQMNLGVIELMRQSKDAGLQADLFRIMLDEIVAECQLPTVSLERLNLEKASGTDWTSEMELRHWAIPLLIQSFARLLIEKGGPNFNEIPVVHTREPEAPIIAVTIQRVDKKSPHALLTEAKTELAAAEKELARMKELFGVIPTHQLEQR